MIDMLQNKLRGHSHFSDETAINRIAILKTVVWLTCSIQWLKAIETEVKY